MSSTTEAEILRLINAAEKVRPKIEGVLSSHTLLMQPHFRLTSRVKTLRRASHKLSEKRIESPEASATDIEDLLGLRIVTLFNVSLLESIGIILDIIQHKGSNDSSVFSYPFAKDWYKFILYTARPDNDPLSIKVHFDNWLIERGCALEYLKFTLPTMYSSLHLITACPVNVERIDGPNCDIMLPVEIQFRTAMEDAWGQISHTTFYIRREDNKHLNALKQILDGCALYADLIKVDSDQGRIALAETNEGPKSASQPYFGGLRNVPADIATAFTVALS